MRLKQYIVENKKLDCALFGAIAGAIIFVLVYGFLPLDVTNDQWIVNGYVIADIRQHYAGWLAFRNSDWNWPLGHADTLGYPDGTIISFTDSIPLVAIFFKAIRAFLPEVFQYFGLYIFGCFILQGVSAAFLLSEFTDNRWTIKIASILFILSPIMIERAFRHTSLASHFLVLFALYLYFHSRHNQYKMEWGYALLLGIVIGIHPYFLPMIFGIFCANVLEMLIHKTNLMQVILYFAATFIPCVVVGIVIGALGAGVSTESSGYGLFSMNVNAIFNPISYGDILWSRVLEPLPLTSGNSEGFNYLGIGMIIGCIAVPICVLMKKYPIDSKFFIRNIGMIIAASVFTAFAVTHVVTFNDKQFMLFTLPEPIYQICCIFRASSRMFYPVFYLIYLVVVVAISRSFSTKKAMIGLSILLGVQILDISPALSEKHNSFQKEVIEQIYAENYGEIEKYWEALGNHYSEIRFIESDIDYTYTTAVFIGKEKFEKTNMQLANRGDYNNTIAESAVNELMQQDYDKGVLYATINENTAGLIGEHLTEEQAIYDVGGCFVICDRMQELALAEFEHVGMIALCELNDANWENGVNRLDPTLWLFDYNEFTEQALRNSSYLYSENNTYGIVAMEAIEGYITVRVDQVPDMSDTETLLRLKPSFDK